MNKPKKKTQDGPVVAQLLELKTRARQALAGNSNDAEHDALYEIEGALVGLIADVRRMVMASEAVRGVFANGQDSTDRGAPPLLAVGCGREQRSTGPWPATEERRRWNVALETDSKMIRRYNRGIEKVEANIGLKNELP